MATWMQGNGAGISELVKLAAQLVIEETLESEVEDVLGRNYYAHGDSAGHRHGSIASSGNSTTP